MILQFGKHKGRSLTELSTPYLTTLLEKDKGLREHTRIEIAKELERRDNDPSYWNIERRRKKL